MSQVDELAETIRKFHTGRQASGLRRKYERLNEGPFEFFRGTAFLFARAWKKLGPREPGPRALISGDLHLENFGAYVTPDGAVRYDINDFDEAVIAPCGFDVVRCATSTLLAAEAWKLGPTHGTAMVLNYLDAYRQTVVEDHQHPPRAEDEPDLGTVRDMLNRIKRRTPEEGIEKAAKQDRDGEWRLRRGDLKLAPVKPRRRKALKKLMKQQGYELVDVMRRFAGIGSLGLRRYQLLVRTSAGTFQLLSLKQASPSAVRTLNNGKMPRFAHQAERVIWAERQLHGATVESLAAVKDTNISYRLRAVIPDENRADLRRLAHKPEKLR